MQRVKDKKVIKGIVNGKEATALFKCYDDGQGYRTEGIFPYKYMYGQKTFSNEFNLREAITRERAQANK